MDVRPCDDAHGVTIASGARPRCTTSFAGRRAYRPVCVFGIKSARVSDSNLRPFPIRYRHRDGPLRDCDRNRLLRPQRTLPGKRQLDAAKRPFKCAARAPGSEPKPPFKFPQSRPTLGPTSFRFYISEAAGHGHQLSAAIPVIRSVRKSPSG
jgi:hypothetical protein